MKITCNSCGSKYTIADAKVQGKKVKVRCKGCKESILVDGTQLVPGESSDDEGDAEEMSGPSAAENAKPEAAPAKVAPKATAAGAAGPASAKSGPPSTSKKGLWSVNLTDDDSREMSLAELVAGWKNGTVTSDAYVWKDGMTDWKPILEVGELKLKLGPAPKKGPGVVSSAGGGPPPPKPAASKSDDLFGGGDSGGGVAAGKQQQQPTGARNDSSVLFSLDSLTSPSADAGSKPKEVDIFGGMSAGGIGGLTSSADLLTAPAKDPPPAPAGVRAAPAAAAAAPIAAPAKSKMPMIIGAVAVAALLIGGAVFAMGGSGDEAGTDEAVAAAKAEAEEKAKKEAEEVLKKAEEEKKKLEAELKKAKEEAAKKTEEPKADDKKSEEEKKAEETKTAATGTAPSPSGSKDKPAESPAPAPSGGGPAFDVGAAKAALNAAAANAAGCGKPGGPTGAGRVQLTFGTSGRVSSASVVSGPFGGTAVGGCVVSAFRQARVPAYSGSPQTVSKSFKIQ